MKTHKNHRNSQVETTIFRVNHHKFPMKNRSTCWAVGRAAFVAIVDAAQSARGVQGRGVKDGAHLEMVSIYLVSCGFRLVSFDTISVISVREMYQMDGWMDGWMDR